MINNTQSTVRQIVLPPGECFFAPPVIELNEFDQRNDKTFIFNCDKKKFIAQM